MTPVQSRRRVCVRTSQSPVTHGEVHRQKGGCDTIHGDFFFFFWCVCIAFFPLLCALLAQFPAPGLQSLAGQHHPEEEEKNKRRGRTRTPPEARMSSREM